MTATTKNAEIARELTALMKAQIPGLKSLEVDEDGFFLVTTKTRKAAIAVVYDLARAGVRITRSNFLDGEFILIGTKA
jgi:hypothetical protein